MLPKTRKNKTFSLEYNRLSHILYLPRQLTVFIFFAVESMYLILAEKSRWQAMTGRRQAGSKQVADMQDAGWRQTGGR
jgi:hypothetical protein